MPFSNPWADGVSTTFRATCAGNTCQPQSSAVSVQKLASCTATPLTCDYYIQALNTTVTPNQETTRLTRITAGGNTYHPLTLKVLTLDGTALPTGLTYSWTVPNSTTPLTTAQIPAAHVGEYKVTITPPSGVGPSQGGGLGVCELYISLSGTPCSDITAAACSCTKDAADPSKIICNPAPQVMPSTTELLSALAPGDQITANDFIITVTSVTATPLSTGAGGVPQGQGVRFSGEGYVTPKLLGGTPTGVAVEFTGIKINPCYQLIEGTVKTKYDPSWSNVVDVEELLQSVGELAALLRDALQNYKGTEAEKEQIDKYLAALKTQTLKDPKLSEQQRNDYLTAYDTQIVPVWNTLKTCSGGGSNLRVAATQTSCSPDALNEAIEKVYETSVVDCLCDASPPTIANPKESDIQVTNGKCISSKGSLSCSKRWFYFAGAAFPALKAKAPDVSNWSAGWYEYEEYSKKIKPVVAAIFDMIGDPNLISPNFNIAAQSAQMFDDFSNSRQMSDEFIETIAPIYEQIRTERARNRNGVVEESSIIFDILSFGSYTGLKTALLAVRTAGSRLSVLGAKKAILATAITARLSLGRLSTNGILEELKWLRPQAAKMMQAEVSAKDIKGLKLELVNVTYKTPSGSTVTGTINVVRTTNGAVGIVHHVYPVAGTDPWRLTVQTLTGILPTNSANAARLSDNLISVGIARPPNSAAHHIVPHGSFSNRDAATRSFIQGIQDIFRREGIDFNEAANGVFLPVSGFPRPPAYLHNNVHTNVYFRNLFDRLRIIPAGKPNDIREVLRDISQELLDGTFPIR